MQNKTIKKNLSNEWNSRLVDNLDIKVPGFEIPRVLWSTLNKIETDQRNCGHTLHK